jgi:hypothetical protein
MDVTTGVGIGMLAGWLVPKALEKTFGTRQIAALKVEAKANAAASKSASARFTIPDFIVYPSITFGSAGSIDGVGAAARGIF